LRREKEDFNRYRGDCNITQLLLTPKTNLQAKSGNASILCIGSNISAKEPPTIEKGDPPKKPARNRQASCAPMPCDSPDPITKSMYIVRDKMYTGFLPKVSDIGPATKAPNPIPARN
jgi:hypothetical protein